MYVIGITGLKKKRSVLLKSLLVLLVLLVAAVLLFNALTGDEEVVEQTDANAVANVPAATDAASLYWSVLMESVAQSDATGQDNQ